MAAGFGRQLAPGHGSMTMETREFIVQSRLEAQALEAWVEAGCLLPRR